MPLKSRRGQMGRFAHMVRRCAVLCILLVTTVTGSVHLQADDEPAPSTGLTAALETSPFLSPETAAKCSNATSVSGNPAAVNILTGNGRLGDALGINRNGWRLGGMTINDVNGILSGGLGPGKWAGQNLTLADLSFDTENAGLWKGGMFGSQFLYYTGYGAGPTVNGIEQSTGSPNALAGTVMGFNSLDGAPPINRGTVRALVSAGDVRRKGCHASRQIGADLRFRQCCSTGPNAGRTLKYSSDIERHPYASVRQPDHVGHHPGLL